jgi:hypothetical protein
MITGVTDTELLSSSWFTVSRDGSTYGSGVRVAEGSGKSSGTTITFDLTYSQGDKYGRPWTEGGSYYLFIGPNTYERNRYCYTNGTGDSQKYNISSATTTITFSKFELW